MSEKHLDPKEGPTFEFVVSLKEDGSVFAYLLFRLVWDLQCHLVQVVPPMSLKRFDEGKEMIPLPVEETLACELVLLSNLFLS